MAEAALVVQPSRSEGMPRISLEALALKANVLLPSGVPEFERYCPESVACSIDPSGLAEQMEQLIHRPCSPTYPIEKRAVETVMGQYLPLLNRSSFNTAETEL